MSRPPTPYSERAAYLGIPGVSQKLRRGKAGVAPPPLVPPHAFHAERERALAADAPAGVIALDLGETLGMRTRATTPSLLGSYVCLSASAEAVTTDFVATSEMYYVVRGRATFEADGARSPVGPGSLLYVRRLVDHRFLDVTEGLEVVVLFAPEETAG